MDLPKMYRDDYSIIDVDISVSWQTVPSRSWISSVNGTLKAQSKSHESNLRQTDLGSYKALVIFFGLLLLNFIWKSRFSSFCDRVVVFVRSPRVRSFVAGVNGFFSAVKEKYGMFCDACEQADIERKEQEKADIERKEPEKADVERKEQEKADIERKEREQLNKKSCSDEIPERLRQKTTDLDRSEAKLGEEERHVQFKCPDSEDEDQFQSEEDDHSDQDTHTHDEYVRYGWQNDRTGSHQSNQESKIREARRQFQPMDDYQPESFTPPPSPFASVHEASLKIGQACDGCKHRTAMYHHEVFNITQKVRAKHERQIHGFAVAIEGLQQDLSLSNELCETLTRCSKVQARHKKDACVIRHLNRTIKEQRKRLEELRLRYEPLEEENQRLKSQSWRKTLRKELRTTQGERDRREQFIILVMHKLRDAFDDDYIMEAVGNFGIDEELIPRISHLFHHDQFIAEISELLDSIKTGALQMDQSGARILADLLAKIWDCIDPYYTEGDDLDDTKECYDYEQFDKEGDNGDEEDQINEEGYEWEDMISLEEKGPHVSDIEEDEEDEEL